MLSISSLQKLATLIEIDGKLSTLFACNAIPITPTVVMLIVITSISSLVHLYSIPYMSKDPHRAFGSYHVSNGLGGALGGTKVMFLRVLILTMYTHESQKNIGDYNT